jgi:iron complex outermembrane receptor protein
MRTDSERVWLPAIILLVSAGVANAQQVAVDASAGGALDEIIVTAQRRAQSIMDVPIAITAIAGDTLAKQGINNSADLASAVPNLQVSSPYGSTQPNFSLRGVSVANEYNSNQASPIGVYIDDVYIAARTSQGMGLFDLDRVEVLRGPQGTLFGRNTTGGATVRSKTSTRAAKILIHRTRGRFVFPCGSNRATAHWM